MTGGWTLASAYHVRAHLASWRASKKLYHLSPFMYPVSCVFCCDCQSTRDDHRRPLAEVVAQRIRARWIHDQDREQDVVVHQVAPAYVERMFKGESAGDGWQFLPPAFRPRGRELPRGLSRVVLLRDLDTEQALAP